MSEGQRGRGSARNDDAADAQRSWKDAWPFLLALIVIVVAAAAIGISHLLRPAEDRMSETARVQHAISDAYTARNNADYAAYRSVTCAAELSSDAFPTESEFVEQNRRSNEQNGHIVIPEITDITVTGDRASAQVHWHFDGKPDEQQVAGTVVVREDGNWKVCKS
ncbi:Rv0361 family membrane protein [Gordonia sp. NPDC003424]